MKNLFYFLLTGFLFLTSCSATSQPGDPIPEHETFKIKSTQVGEERTINVWIPGHYKSGSDSLPVMYMADGGIKEDFPHVANTLAKLIQEKKINPLVLVGIENTIRRRDLTGFTEVAKDKQIAPVVGGSAKFRAFISEELIPNINKKYRTTKDRTIIGESASGLFVMETFFLTPDLFSNYIAFDPSLWWNNHYLIGKAKEHLANFPKEEKRVWFAGSDATDISPYTKKLAEIFTIENLPNLKWRYSDEPEETHTTIFRATKEKALIWALNKSE